MHFWYECGNMYKRKGKIFVYKIVKINNYIVKMSAFQGKNKQTNNRLTQTAQN